MTSQVTFQRYPARESTGDKLGAHFQADYQALPLFNFGGAKIRTAGTPEAPLFCAADVCKVLGYADVSQVCEKLDQEEVEQIGAEKGSQRILYAGPNANMYVTESGFPPGLSPTWSPNGTNHACSTIKDHQLLLLLARPARKQRNSCHLPYPLTWNRSRMSRKQAKRTHRRFGSSTGTNTAGFMLAPTLANTKSLLEGQCPAVATGRQQ